jgi:hypothetical protein
MSDLQLRGPVWGGTGTPSPFSAGVSGAQRVSDAHARYTDAVLAGRVWSLALALTTTGVAAGNIVGAAAAASTQFALWNPANSKVNLVLWLFGMGVVSGTPGAGPMFHSLMLGTPSIASVGGPAINNLAGGAGSVARFIASAGGSAATGGPALTTLRLADFSSTATAQASVGELKAIEYIDGGIILPNTGWVPCWSAAGAALINGYSITWEELLNLP